MTSKISISQIYEKIKIMETNDYFFNYFLGMLIDLINSNCLEPYGRYILFSEVAILLNKPNLNSMELIKVCLYITTSRLLAIYIYSFCMIMDTVEFKYIKENKELQNIDWNYVKERTSKSIFTYSKFLDLNLENLDEKSVLIFNREKRKLFQNKELFEEIQFQMPIPPEFRTEGLNLYDCKESM